MNQGGQSFLNLMEGALPSNEIVVEFKGRDNSNDLVPPPNGNKWTFPLVCRFFRISSRSLRPLILSDKKLRELLDVKFGDNGSILTNQSFKFTHQNLEDAEEIVDQCLRRQWTIAKLARKLGYRENTVITVLKESEDFTKLLRVTRKGRGRAYLPPTLRLTTEDLVQAERIIREYLGDDHAKWSRDHKRCVKCQTTDRAHRARGYCTKCYWEVDNQSRPRSYRLEKEYWDQKRKFKACQKCWSNKRPHYAKGHCLKCYSAVFSRGAGEPRPGCSQFPLPKDKRTVARVAGLLRIEKSRFRALLQEFPKLEELLDVQQNHRGRICAGTGFNFTAEQLEEARDIVELSRRWSLKKIADKMGYYYVGIRNAIHACPELAQKLKVVFNSEGLILERKSYYITEQEVEEAERIYARFKGYEDNWARSFTKCKECETTEIPHVAKGLCRSCYHRKPKEELKQDRSFWDSKRKRKRCRSCKRSKKPHYCDGYCQSCYHAIVIRGMDYFEPPLVPGGRRRWKKRSATS